MMKDTRPFPWFIAVAAAVMGVAGLWSGSNWEATSQPLRARPGRVVLLGLPGLGWSDVTQHRMPNLVGLARTGAIAGMNVRTLSAQPASLEAYASINAGTRLAAPKAGLGNDPVQSLRQANHGKHVSSPPGAMGDALHRAGRRTAAVGSADAAAAVMDSAGRVDIAAIGVASADEIVTATVAAAGEAAVTAVDAGRISPPAADAIVGGLARSLPTDALLLVFAPTPPGRQWHLEPLVVAGMGIERGRLLSPSTRHLGLVTMTDLAPTALSALGIPPQSGMDGHALRYHHEADVTFASAARLDREGIFRAAFAPVVVDFIIFLAVLYPVALGLFRRDGWVTRVAPFLRAAVLFIAAFPLATFGLRAVPNAPSLGFGAGVVALLAICAALAALAGLDRRRPLAPLLWLFGVTAWLILIDVATGARLQTNSLIGIAPTTAPRFFGLGNPAFAVLASTSVLAACIYLSDAADRRQALAVVTGFLALVVVAVGAPSLGDNLGALLTLVVVFGLALWVLFGRSVRGRTAAGAGIAAVLAIGIATGVDLLRPPNARTHLGRFAAQLANGHASDAWATVARKVDANMHGLTASVWTVIVVVIAVVLFVLLAFGRFTELLPPGSPHRVGVMAALAAGILGFVVEDSGPIITALVFVSVGPYLILLGLARERPPPLAGAGRERDELSYVET